MDERPVGIEFSTMRRRLRHSICILVLGAIAFSHVSLVVAPCEMDRANLAQVLSPASGEDCCDGAAMDDGGVMPMTPTSCVAHATSDLQILGVALPFDHLTQSAVVALYLPLPHLPAIKSRALPLSRSVPARILLHSFQV